MTGLIFDIPESADELPRWLDRHLVGPNLAGLIAELSAVQGAQTAVPLSELLGDSRTELLEHGLARLPPARLQRLLRQPTVLADLQELILLEGGPYWQRLAAECTDLNESVRHGEKRLRLALEEATGLGRTRQPIYRRPWFVSLATAAVLLVSLGVWHWLTPPKEAPPLREAVWGWATSDALPTASNSGEYLRRLADGAGEWFKKRPDNALALARRITEFRQGCSVLLLAEHRPLNAADRAWLISHCHAWSATLDEQLASLERTRDVAAVRASVDELAVRIQKTLRSRGEGG
jgi:hypothetical protein